MKSEARACSRNWRHLLDSDVGLDGKAKVTYDSGKTNVEAMKGVIKRAGYGVK
ncbi:MAG: hypothetical protein M1598_08075 [Actinobacteria bacterium]|nr:hypothetical protein [Actinomycetota bacterium]